MVQVHVPAHTELKRQVLALKTSPFRAHGAYGALLILTPQWTGFRATTNSSLQHSCRTVFCPLPHSVFCFVLFFLSQLLKMETAKTASVQNTWGSTTKPCKSTTRSGWLTRTITCKLSTATRKKRSSRPWRTMMRAKKMPAAMTMWRNPWNWTKQINFSWIYSLVRLSVTQSPGFCTDPRDRDSLLSLSSTECLQNSPENKRIPWRLWFIIDITE